MKKLPLYVALDLDEEEKALSVARKTAPYVEGFKIGPRLYFKSGPSIILKLKPYGKVFLDFKFFDIPSTMCSAVQSAFNQGVDMLTVHALSGAESLKKLADLESKLNQTGFKMSQAPEASSFINQDIKYENSNKIKRDFKILAVTVLTSFSDKTLPPPLCGKPLPSLVESLSDLVIESGLSGLVCAGHEVSLIRKKYPTAYLLTPGIRFDKSAGDHKPGGYISDDNKLDSHRLDDHKPRDNTPGDNKPGTEDQKRVFTPLKALEAGANSLVIGRPIYESPDPAGVCARLQQELDKSTTISG